MGFWKRLFAKRKLTAYEEEDYDYYDWDNVNIRTKDVDMADPVQREKYIRALLEQAADAELTVDSLAGEYGRVTSYLKDMEEIEALPETERRELNRCAENILKLETSGMELGKRQVYMTEEDFRRMERIESEVKEGIQKIRENEDYRALIKQDLKRLDAERQANEIRRQNLSATMANSKGTALIGIVAMGICFLALIIFQFALSMDVSIGYIMSGIILAGILVYVNVRYHEADVELLRVEKNINKLILLQNRVKIRYVNNTNLLDYLYMKYSTSSGNDLQEQYELFVMEANERERYERALEELSFYKKELMRILRKFQLYDPGVWLYQCEALVNSKEMIEIRHGYIQQRQKLRSQMDHNRDIAEKGKEEIRGIVARYPAYAKEILGMVEEFEQENNN